MHSPVNLQTLSVSTKLRDAKCKVANKCLNVRERVEVVKWNKRWSPPFPCCPVSRQCLWKKILIEKKKLVVIPYHSLSLFVIRCHSLSLVVIRYHSLYHSLLLVLRLVVIRCHSLSFVVTRCTTRCHSLLLDVLLVCLFTNDHPALCGKIL